MANLLQSSQNTATTAPGYYNTYLSNLAQCGQKAVCNATYVGATDLQNKAFNTVGCAANAGQPNLGAATNTLGAAAGSVSPLAAGASNLQNATTCAALRAQNYMNPYISCVVNAIGDLGQQNIRQNLAPMATAAAVGSGQFGSQRGAQVLGQTLANANQQILACQTKALQCGYKTALCTGIKQNQLCGQLGQISGTLASCGIKNLTNIGTAQGTLSCIAQQQGLKGVNALATLGCQQRTLLQNAQCYPLTKLTNLSNLLKGYTVPTSTKQTMCMSPLSGLASVGSTAAGLFAGTGKCGTGPSVFCQIKKAFGSSGAVNTGTTGQSSDGTSTGTMDYSGGLTATPSSTSPTGYVNSAGQPVDMNGNPVSTSSTGGIGNMNSGSLNPAGGSSDTTIPSGAGTAITNPAFNPSGYNGACCESVGSARGGSIHAAHGGPIGCVFTRHMGGLPSFRR